MGSNFPYSIDWILIFQIFSAQEDEFGPTGRVWKADLAHKRFFHEVWFVLKKNIDFSSNLNEIVIISQERDRLKYYDCGDVLQVLKDEHAELSDIFGKALRVTSWNRTPPPIGFFESTDSRFPLHIYCNDPAKNRFLVNPITYWVSKKKFHAKYDDFVRIFFILISMK